MIVEPEIVWHNLCPKSLMYRNGKKTAICYLARRLDDEAGHQRVYICERCGAEISVNFPPY